MQNAWFYRIPVLFLLGILVAPPAQATVMIYLNNKELTERASVVVRGMVVRKQVVEIEGHLWTDSHVRVIESLKGGLAKGHVLRLRQPGGETRTLGEHVAGVARFTVGEEVLVFARRVASHHVPVGMCLGKFRIVRPSSGAPRAERDLSTVAFGMFDLSGKFQASAGSKADSRVLSQLLATIKSHLKQPRLLLKIEGGAR